jgi:hypothetical protein
MRFLFTLLFVLSLGYINAQVTFHGSISRLNKISFTEMGGVTYDQNENLDFPEFSIYQSLVSYYRPIRMAIDIGLSYKKHRITLGQMKDGVSSEYKVRHMSYDPFLNSTKPNSISGSSRSDENRAYLNYEYILFGKDKKTNFFISTSIGLCYRAGPKGIGNVGTLSSSGNLNNTGAKITVTSAGYTADAKYIWNFGAGLGTDLYYKKHYFFTLFANFNYSNNYLGFDINTVTISDNNISKSYEFEMLSLRKGIYFGISRRFQFYPWKPIKPKWEKFKTEGIKL